MPILLNNVSVDTTSDTFESLGGVAIVNVRGDNYGGGSVLIEAATVNDSATRFVTLPNGTFTADGTVKLDYLPQGALIRARLDSSTTPTNVFVDILQ